MQDARRDASTGYCDTIFVARQPVFNARMDIWGYELLYRNASTAATASFLDGNIATSKMIADGVALARCGISMDKKIFINFTTNLIEEEFGFALNANESIIEILETVEPTPSVLRALEKLKKAGYTLAVDDYDGRERFAPLLAIADIIKVDMLSTPVEMIPRLLEKVPNPKVLLLAEKVEDMPGIGMSADQLAGIFSPFNQADTGTTRHFGGTGLGLPISRHLARLMGGDIRATSRPGKGSAFEVTVRLLPAADHAIPRPGVSLKDQRVLVVDDSPLALDIMALVLGQLGITATGVINGAEAMRLLLEAVADAPFDVVLIDCELAEGSGLALARAIREEPRLTPAPVLLLCTGHDAQAVTRLPLYEPDLVSACLQKPVGIPVLRQTLLCVLDGRGAGETTTAAPMRETAQGLSGVRVLIVEDNAINQQVMSKILTRVGVLASVAGSGKNALELLERKAFDIILMDIQMPEMDGFETVRRIRQMLPAGPPPIIAMTALAFATDKERALAVGMDGFLTKPVDTQVLYATLRQHLCRDTRPPRPSGKGPYAWLTPHTAIQDLCLDEGLAFAGGDFALYRELLHQFMTLQRVQLPEIRQAVLDGAYPEAEILLHALSDRAGHIGARVVETLAASLHEALHAKCPRDFVVRLMSLLEGAADRLDGALPDGAATDGSDRPDGQPAS